MMEKPAHRVALYARVSTPGQAERDLSVPQQLEALRQFCADRGWTVVREYADEGVSGGKQIARKQFQLMLNEGLEKKPPFTLILTRDGSRFGRGDEDPGIRARLRGNGVSVDSIESPSGDMDGSMSPHQKTMERMKWVMDVSQREEVAPRVRASQIRAAATGRFPGANGTVYGYRQDYIGDGPRPKRTVELDPVTAPIVAEMFRRYMDGGSVRSVTKWLQESGAPTPRNALQWYEATVKRILRNETVLGSIIYGRLRTLTNPETDKPRYVKSDKEPVRFEGAFPPLVSREIFDAAQKRLSRKNRIGSQRGNPANLLRGLGFCSHCGWSLAFQQRRGRWYYLCGTKKTYTVKADPRCSGTLPADYVESVVFEYLRRSVSVPEYRQTLKRAVAAYNEAVTQHSGQPDLEIIDARIKSLETSRGNFVRAIANGIDSLSVKDALEDAELQLSEARKRRDELRIALRGIPRLDDKQILTVASALRSAVRAKDILKIKDFLGGLVDRIDVDLTRRSNRRVTFNLRTEVPLTPPEGVETRPLDEDSIRLIGGKGRLRSLVERAAENAVANPEDLRPLIELAERAGRKGLGIEQKVEEGRITTTITDQAPLTFVPKYDLSNLERMSAEALRKIGAVASL